MCKPTVSKKAVHSSKDKHESSWRKPIFSKILSPALCKFMSDLGYLGGLTNLTNVISYVWKSIHSIHHGIGLSRVNLNDLSLRTCFRLNFSYPHFTPFCMLHKTKISLLQKSVPIPMSRLHVVCNDRQVIWRVSKYKSD